ncbi:MAG TPA: cytochrome c oxidase subunit 3 [Woeseiaceae bacterium]|nr:cytochrome c oxidase subunit 3 [Woeseiaceae bacterium]
MPDSRALRAQFDDLGQQREAAALGMWVLLATEVLFFGALFTGYTVYRLAFHDAFVAGSGHLNVVLGTANTAVLITSSLTMALADVASRSGSRRAVIGFLAATAVLGSAFLAIKGLEYAQEYREGLVPLNSLVFSYSGPDAERVQMFFNFYFAMTGWHSLHLLIGIGLLIVFIVLAWRGRDRVRLEGNVRAGALYWHFVDIVWLFLFPVLYLVR